MPEESYEGRSRESTDQGSVKGRSHADKGDQIRRNSHGEANHNRRKGMVLPFEPHSITFDDITYSVDMPQVN